MKYSESDNDLTNKNKTEKQNKVTYSRLIIIQRRQTSSVSQNNCSSCKGNLCSTRKCDVSAENMG